MNESTHVKLLHLLQENPSMSQRQLAAELGVSLGKINYCVRALVDKGWLKAGNFRKSKNKSAYAYQLTPKGIKEKAAITVRFLKVKEAEHEALMAEIATLRQLVADDAGQPAP